MKGSQHVKHVPCGYCGSSNAGSIYTDGHFFCHKCHKHERGTSVETDVEVKPKSTSALTFQGDFTDFPTRLLREDTCRFWSYKYGEVSGKPAHLAYYLDENRKPVAAKVRFQDKSFSFIGEPNKAGLYGQWLWPNKGKMIVVTEGEIDAISVSQLQNNKYPVVSVPNGAQGAVKALKRSMAWLDGYDSIILMFDMDEPGQQAAKECAELFSPGKCKIASLPFKDANECLVKGKGDEVIRAIWTASVYRPDGVVNISDIREAALKRVEWGLPWFLEGLTKATYGRRPTEIYCIGAGTGVGKTDFITEQIAYDVVNLNKKVGLVFLEQPVGETAKRIAGKIAGKRFHVPDAGWTDEELVEALDMIADKVELYDHFGETSWDIVKQRVRYMKVALDCDIIYVDHLTAMANPSNERESLETLMKELASLAQELGLIIHLISHLSTPEGKSHEEGGRVMIKHFKGARAIGFWCYFMLGMERNQQDDDESQRHTTCIRVLKDRYTGQGTGKTINIHYNDNTGQLTEVPAFAGEF